MIADVDNDLAEPSCDGYAVDGPELDQSMVLKSGHHELIGEIVAAALLIFSNVPIKCANATF